MIYNTPKPGLAGEDAVIQDLPLGFTENNIEVVPASAVFE